MNCRICGSVIARTGTQCQRCVELGDDVLDVIAGDDCNAPYLALRCGEVLVDGSLTLEQLRKLALFMERRGK